MTDTNYMRVYRDIHQAGVGDLVACACGCGGTFRQKDYNRRPRFYIRGHNRKGTGTPRSEATRAKIAAGVRAAWRQRNGPRDRVISCACGCGATFPEYSATGYRRRFLFGHGRRGKRWTEKERYDIGQGVRRSKADRVGAILSDEKPPNGNMYSNIRKTRQRGAGEVRRKTQ